MANSFKRMWLHDEDNIFVVLPYTTLDNIKIQPNLSSNDLLSFEEDYNNVKSIINQNKNSSDANFQTINSRLTQIESNINNNNIDLATIDSNGLMSSEDKAKLNNIADNANYYILPAATISALGGVKPDGTTIIVDADGTLHSTGGGGGSIDTLSDVDIDELLVNGQILQYDAVLGKWKNVNLNLGNIQIDIDNELSNTSRNPVENRVIKRALDNLALSSINDISDINIDNNLADKQVIAYDEESGLWKNQNPPTTYNDIYAETSLNLGRLPVDENDENTIIGEYSSTLGSNLIASGDYSHAEGFYTTALGVSSHAEGQETYANEGQSHAEGLYTTALGVSSHAEGANTYANGSQSHAEGINTKALGQGSHTEGVGTVATTGPSHAEGFYSSATGEYSHAEGNHTCALGQYCHTEGQETYASGINSHAEGNATYARENQSHAEGYGTTANNYMAHAEGRCTCANGKYSHAEGNTTYAIGTSSHAEGENTYSNNTNSHAEGLSTSAIGTSSHAEGFVTYAGGQNSHTEGYNTYAFHMGCHAEGGYTTALDMSNYYGVSHAEGYSTLAQAFASHSEGYKTTATGYYAHAEGNSTSATSSNAHAEGNATTAGTDSHAEGSTTYSFGGTSHTEGYKTTATGSSSHAEGQETYAKGSSSHAEGYRTNATSSYAHSEGYYSYANYLAHAEGDYTTAYSTGSHSEGQHTYAAGSGSHAEGNFTTASGSYAHTEGYNSYADYAAHAEGYSTTAISQSHAEGYQTYANLDSHAEGYATSAFSYDDHAEGDRSITKGKAAHAEGECTSALKENSHTEGTHTIALGIAQHVGGSYNIPDPNALYILGNGHKTTYSYNKNNNYSCSITDTSDSKIINFYKDNDYLTDYNINKNGYELNYDFISDALVSCETPVLKTISDAEPFKVSELSEGEVYIYEDAGYPYYNGDIYYEIVVNRTNSTTIYRIGLWYVDDMSTTDDNNSNAHTIDWDGNAWFAGDVTDGSGNTLSTIAAAVNQSAGSGNGTNANNYSINEAIIGTWIDGKPLYQKTLNIGSLPSAADSDMQFVHNIANLDHVWIYDSIYENPSNGYTNRANLSNNTWSGSWYTAVDKNKIHMVTGTDRSMYAYCYVTLRYTKTTDQIPNS